MLLYSLPSSRILTSKNIGFAGLNGGQNNAQQRLVHVQTFSMYYKSEVASGMPTNHHHGHAHASNKDKGYVISTHSVIPSPASPPPSQSPNAQDIHGIGGRQSRCEVQSTDQHRGPSSGTTLSQYPNSSTRGAPVISGNSVTVSSSTANRYGGISPVVNQPNISPPTSAVASSSSRLSTLLLSTTPSSGVASANPSYSLPVRSPFSEGPTSEQPNQNSAKNSSPNPATVSENSPKTNEATQKNLLLKQLLNVSFPSSASGSSAGAAAAAAQAAAEAAASSSSIKGDSSAPRTINSEKSPSPPSANSRILQLLSQNNDSLSQQTISHRLSDRSQSYGLPNDISNRQPQNVPISSRLLLSTSTSTVTSAGIPTSTLNQMVGGASSNNLIGGRQSLKRAASDPLGEVPGAKQQIAHQQTTLSAVCSENPSLASLLSKPPVQASRTVPPPVPTKWHQEPKEKLPRDIMRKFLPPHPAERSSSRKKSTNLSPVGGEAPLSSISSSKSLVTITTSMLASGMSRSSATTQASNNLQLTTSSSSHNTSSANPSNIPISAASSTSTRGLTTHKLSLDTLAASQISSRSTLTEGSNIQGSVSSEPSDDDPMLDAILNDVIEIQEKSPPLTGGQGRVHIGHKRSSKIPGNQNVTSMSPNTVASPASAAILAEHSQISDIEKYLASAENTPPRENSPLQNVPNLRRDSDQLNQSHLKLHNTSTIIAKKSLPPPPPSSSSSSSSSALSSPSLTSILSAPPIAAISVPMRNLISGNQSTFSTTTQVPGAQSTSLTSSSLSSMTKTQTHSSNHSDSSNKLLAPRMNELLSVPPNVSLSECPDLTSLIHLQNAQQESQGRRRMSSGGGPSSISNNGNTLSGSAPNMNNVAMPRQGWRANMEANNTIRLPQSLPQDRLSFGQGAREAVSRTPPSAATSISMLQSPVGSNALVPITSGIRIQSGNCFCVLYSTVSNNQIACGDMQT